MNFLTRVEQAAKAGKLSPELAGTLHSFHSCYLNAAAENGFDKHEAESTLKKFLDLVAEQLKNPYPFELFHERVMSPFNYYKFGIDFIRPLVIANQSKAMHLQHADSIVKQLANGDNVILLANHQIELDPQAISLLLEKTHPRLAEEMIFVAGHRVITDPLAAPFSMGRNLLCIYSKKHIELDPSLKEERQLHNQRTMNRMAQLLSLGGKCIYVAPSGGRDRPDKHGHVDVAHFDPSSIEMFWLMAQKSGHPTHFYPLALATFHLLPPPVQVEKELGERRVTKATPIHLAFGPEVDMERFPGSDDPDKKQRRKHRAQYIWEQVRNDYKHLSAG